MAVFPCVPRWVLPVWRTVVFGVAISAAFAGFTAPRGGGLQTRRIWRRFSRWRLSGADQAPAEDLRSAKACADIRLAKVSVDARCAKVSVDARSAKVAGDARSAKVPVSTRSAKVRVDTRSAKVRVDRSANTHALGFRKYTPELSLWTVPTQSPRVCEARGFGFQIQADSFGSFGREGCEEVFALAFVVPRRSAPCRVVPS